MKQPEGSRLTCLERRACPARQDSEPIFLSRWRGGIFGLPAGDVFLAEEFCEVGPLKAKFFSCACLIPVISAQRLFEDLPTVRFHAFMVVTGG